MRGPEPLSGSREGPLEEEEVIDTEEDLGPDVVDEEIEGSGHSGSLTERARYLRGVLEGFDRLRRENRDIFRDEGVARAYSCRPAYPEELVSVLRGLVPDAARTVVEVGCGPGEISRRLAPDVDRAIGVDPSRAMLERGRALPGGERVEWVEASGEEYFEDGRDPEPVGLVVSADSLVWLDWERVAPGMRSRLVAGGRFAVVHGRMESRSAWGDEARALAIAHSTIRDYPVGSLVETLRELGHFEVDREIVCAPHRIVQRIDDYIERCHSQASASRVRQGPEGVAAYDAALRRMLEPHARDGFVEYDVVVSVDAGWPVSP